MKFQAFREFRDSGVPVGDTKDILEYLRIDLASFLKDWATGFLHINFKDNFQHFIYKAGSSVGDDMVSIPSLAEIAIPNKMRPVIPSMRIVVRGNEYASYVQDGPTRWTQDFLYLKNYGAGSAEVTVLFLK
jgi:hypothetical protein